MLCDELSEYAGKQEMGTGELDVIHKLTDSIKNIDKIAMFEIGGYSRYDGYYRGGDWDASIRGTCGRGFFLPCGQSFHRHVKVIRHAL